MKTHLILLMMIGFISYAQEEQQSSHQAPTHNFTVQRLIIINNKNEILMAREQHVWAPPSLLFNERQYIKESLDSLSKAYGVKISSPQLRGQFSFKYDYHPYATIRNYYIAHHLSGEIKIPKGINAAQWMPIPVAIKKNTVTAIKEISEQIIKFPNVVWGGSFLVSHIGDDHPTQMTEEFYPLFQLNDND